MGPRDSLARVGDLLDTAVLRRLDCWRTTHSLFVRPDGPEAEQAVAQVFGRHWKRAPTYGRATRRVVLDQKPQTSLQQLEAGLGSLAGRVQVAPEEGTQRKWDALRYLTSLPRARREVDSLWLVDALRAGGFFVLFQPIVDLSTGQAIGYEGFLRAYGPEGKEETAAEIFDAVRALEIEKDFQRFSWGWVLEAARRLPADSSVFLNVHPELFAADGSHLASLQEEAARAGVALSRLVLDLVQIETVEPTEELKARLVKAQELGLGLALDDVTSGYDALRHCANLRPRWIKLDGSVTKGIAKEPRRRVLLQFLTKLANDYAFAIVAEGIESAEDLDVCAGSGVAAAQGYFLAKPESSPAGASPDFRAWFSSRSHRRAEQALRATEKRYRLLFERNLAGVYRTTPDGRILDCNDSFARILGFCSREEVLSSGAIHPYFRLADREPSPDWPEKGSSGGGFETCLRRKDGSPVWVLQTVNLMEGEGDAPFVLEGIVMDITERKLAEEQLRISRQQLRALSVHLQLAREEERRRIAREIHDELGQALTALKMDLAWLRGQLAEGEGNLVIKTKAMSELVYTTIQTVRRISTELRPAILDLGLAAAIEWQAHEFQARAGVKPVLKLMEKEIRLDAERSTGLFRILQEALTNVVRHAAATQVQIQLQEQAGSLMLEVRDNGKGITASQISSSQSLGLTGMRERVLAWGGKVRIEGILGRGTVVSVTIPLEEPVSAGRPE